MLQNRILETLRFFGLQKTALTLLEVHKFLVVGKAGDVVEGDKEKDLGEENIVPEIRAKNGTVSLNDIYAALDELVQAGKVAEKYGYFSLSEYPSISGERWRGHYFGSFREQRIQKFIGALKYIPFVRGVGLAGSQALGLARKESDIDLFVITEKKWLWLPRTLVTVYFQIFGIRRHGKFIENRFCLNHYITENKLIESGQSFYTAMEYGKLRPLVNANFISSFKKINLPWINSFFPNLRTPKKTSVRLSPLQRFFEYIFNNKFGERLEGILKKWQIKRIRLTDPHTLASEDELFFSPHSKEDKLVPAFLRGEY